MPEAAVTIAIPLSRTAQALPIGWLQQAEVLPLIEVAEASLRYDREVKVPLYARHGIPAVRLLDLAGHELTGCQRPAGDGHLQPRIVTDQAAVALPGPTDLAVDLSTLF